MYAEYSIVFCRYDSLVLFSSHDGYFVLDESRATVGVGSSKYLCWTLQATFKISNSRRHHLIVSEAQVKGFPHTTPTVQVKLIIDQSCLTLFLRRYIYCSAKSQISSDM
jgi:hypothetical protein